ncbi:MAG TPA: hypothetical protein VHT28_13920 [Silvibacterium sp.]|nr:hypothetical protein [Silvibacterium sp.]
MRTTLRVALDGWTILTLALFSAALYCALRSLRSRRAIVSHDAPGEFAPRAQTPSRRPAFLSRGNLLQLRKR